MNYRKLAIVMGFLFALPTLPCHAETATFVVDILNTWSEETHPDAFPPFAHFSHVGGSTHNADGHFWAVDELANPGVVQMAETGLVTILLEQLESSLATGETYSVIDQRHWFCPEAIESDSCGPTTFEFEADSEFPFFSLVTMLGPSPDWFVGLSGFSLRTDEDWVTNESIELYPYDGGTRSENVFLLGGEQNEPPEPISLITEESGQLVTPQSLGTLTISRKLACDLDGDFACSASDIDLLNAFIRSAENVFDLNDDGATDELDRTHWLELLDTRLGDADLDGTVAFADFLSLSRNFGAEAGWAEGDFDGSGFVEFPDFLLLSSNFGMSNANDVQNLPEPASNQFLLLLVTCLAIRAAGVRHAQYRDGS